MTNRRTKDCRSFLNRRVATILRFDRRRIQVRRRTHFHESHFARKIFRRSLWKNKNETSWIREKHPACKYEASVLEVRCRKLTERNIFASWRYLQWSTEAEVKEVWIVMMMNRKTAVAVFTFWTIAWQQSKNMLKCDIWRHSASTKNRRSCTLYREQYVNGLCDWKTFHKNNSRRSLIWMNTAIDTNHCQWYAVRRSTIRLNDKANSLWWHCHLTEDSKQENSLKIVR